ncbi:XRE family transcriptional regulator [Lactobacillus jensenii]|jgi:hypothetical protein|uniref:XRE family transcriptional regulator n=2 Tax=Lactobacillus TaxID=1578 RepID=A0AAP3M3T8_9LACO|nr:MULTISPECIES: hypothetical protein [Lactobacillus]EEX27959.1 hypothetical protein HMPREF0527_00194 [Lactobacillus jensenii SJ-7A-US]KAA9260152.1 XRE family transcriptional regulator [Lactobacillus jensenii]KAA9369888.1 XRE family transcriptional regulator [Lactobacillus jensenii]KAA9372711.1 XRE family transcriptional regulator [Lactobacillus jensenii]MBS5831910.1 XRE family transcriptional regulator [Lactobacillus jensenii]
MSDLTFQERIAVQFLRNKKLNLKPTSKSDIAQKFELSKTYVNWVIDGRATGPAADEWKDKFAKYVGI